LEEREEESVTRVILYGDNREAVYMREAAVLEDKEWRKKP